MNFLSSRESFIAAIINYNNIFYTEISIEESNNLNFDDIMAALIKDEEFNSLKYVCYEEELIDYIFSKYIEKKL